MLGFRTARISIRVLMVCVFFVVVQRGMAHEIVPSVVEIKLEQNQAQLTLYINAEAILANIDLRNLENTNDAANADTYDAFRALSAAEIEKTLVDRWQHDVGKNISLIVRNQAVLLKLVDIEVTEELNPDFPRDTKIIAHATLPSQAQAVQFSWAPHYGTVGVIQVEVDNPYVAILAGGDISKPIALDSSGASQSIWSRFVEYIPIGFVHIVPSGLDHILFVLGLFFFSYHLRLLILQVSAFTVAHTVSLMLATLGVVSLPAHIVEPLIAVSIVYVALENIFFRHKDMALHTLVIFLFGILHGFGFASVLDAFGLPADHFIAALLGFNVGVELGQLLVICVAIALTFWVHKKNWYHKRITVPCSLLIAAVGAFWFVERVFF